MPLPTTSSFRRAVWRLPFVDSVARLGITIAYPVDRWRRSAPFAFARRRQNAIAMPSAAQISRIVQGTGDGAGADSVGSQMLRGEHRARIAALDLVHHAH
jgi:hypothetical protein